MLSACAGADTATNAATAANANVVFMFPYPCSGCPTGMPYAVSAPRSGRKVSWLHNLVFRYFDQIADLGQEGLPPGIGQKPLSPRFPVVQARKGPDVDDLVDRSDLREK